jgi:ABC-2 type transport system permease protein
MNPPSNCMPEFAVDSQGIAPVAMSPTRPMYWSVRRELWENRSIYVAPLVVEAVVLFGFLISTITLPHRMRAALALDPAKQHEAVTMPYNVAAGLTILTAFIIGVFYCLDALHGERRDRSFLFWKSLPVSDRTTVLSRSIPLMVLPLYIFAIIVAAQRSCCC